jgi:hypothetical protein
MSFRFIIFMLIGTFSLGFGAGAQFAISTNHRQQVEQLNSRIEMLEDNAFYIEKLNHEVVKDIRALKNE